MRVQVLVQQGCFGSAVASVIEILRVADAIRGDVDPSIAPIDLAVAARTKRVATTTSMTLSADCSLSEVGDADLVIVPALGTLTATDTVDALNGRNGRSAIEALSTVDLGSTRIAAACTGVFALAETGVIDGLRATTSWFLGPAFRTRYPAVDLDLDAMVVEERGVLTAGAAFAHIDLALAVVRSVSPDLARLVGDLLLIDERPSQAMFVAYEHLEHEDPVVIDFERHVRANLDQPFDAAAAALAVGTSRRTLERRIRAALNLSPLGFVQRMRLERAQYLLATTDLSNADIALRVGYANAETLRALLRRSRSNGTSTGTRNGGGRHDGIGRH
ncbi:MAG: helix-turn-helix domain-containing protein [Actinomycetota bacterium]